MLVDDTFKTMHIYYPTQCDNAVWIGHGSALNIRRPYATDNLRSTLFRVSWGKIVDFSAFLQIDNLSEFNFAISVLNNKTVILLNPLDIAWV